MFAARVAESRYGATWAWAVIDFNTEEIVRSSGPARVKTLLIFY